MSNPPRQKGTAAETAVVRWARENGFGHADRQPLRGGRDQGDIALCPGVIVEVKNHNGGPAVGQPAPGVLTEWMLQTEIERANAGADIGVLVVKRAGTRDVGRWFAYVSVWTLADVLSGPLCLAGEIETTLRAPVCLAVADLAALLRAAGWGDQLEDGAA